MPADINREYTYDDFESVFEVEPLHQVIMEENVAMLLKNHDLTTDEFYRENNNAFPDLLDRFSAFLEMDTLEQRDREYIAIKFISPKIGFGAFAKKLIKKGELVGRYTGVINLDEVDTDYMWTYHSYVINGIEYNIGIDGRLKGNYIRFINHSGPDCNAEAEYVPYNNRWYVLYIATKDIQPGEEITTNYGEEYFESRLEYGEEYFESRLEE